MGISLRGQFQLPPDFAPRRLLRRKYDHCGCLRIRGERNRTNATKRHSSRLFRAGLTKPSLESIVKRGRIVSTGVPLQRGAQEKHPANRKAVIACPCTLASRRL